MAMGGIWQCGLRFAQRHIILVLMIKFFTGLAIGFVLGIYTLPILIADPPVEDHVIIEASESAPWQVKFRRDLPGSDALHWGDGRLLIQPGRATLIGKLAPGPDYRLYFTPLLASDASAFLAIKDRSREVVAIRGFENVSYPLPEDLNPADYQAVVIWCERFSQFITAGRLEQRQE